MHYSAIKSILLVDDDKDDIYFFATALNVEHQDVELMTASDGHEAFQKLQVQIPDLILLDLNMPGMDGKTFLKKIKKIKPLNEIPIIIYTGQLSIFEETELRQAGVYSIYIKPEEFIKTVKTISEILQMNFIRMIA